MYSIKLKDSTIIDSIELLDISLLKPHEHIIVKRKNTLKKYIESYNNYVVIPSIICCSKTYIIIDGHHRYQTLLDLGAKKVPVTKIDYFNPTIRTHSVESKALSKKTILESVGKKKLPPKSSIHEIQILNLDWKPIILISSLCEFKLSE